MRQAVSSAVLTYELRFKLEREQFDQTEQDGRVFGPAGI